VIAQVHRPQLGLSGADARGRGCQSLGRDLALCEKPIERGLLRDDPLAERDCLAFHLLEYGLCPASLLRREGKIFREIQHV
jgi:hypothetical protein